MGGPSAGSRFVPEGSLARQYSPALLQLSHHGRAGDYLHRRDGAIRLRALAGDALRGAEIVVADHADAAFSVYRHHRRLDHRGTGPPALADLWHHAYAHGIFPACLRRKRAFHADRFYGHVHDPWNSIS